MKPLTEGDRIVVKFDAGDVMGYFLKYYDRRYAVCHTDDQQRGGNLLAERRRISKAPAEAANIQIFEATTPLPTNKEA